MPLFAAVPAFLGAVGAAAGVTGAGITAGASIAAGTAIVGATTAGVLGAVTAAKQNAAMKKLSNAQANPDSSQTVGDLTANQTTQAQNNGRAALISTSPSGVQGTDPTGRRKLLGNE